MDQKKQGHTKKGEDRKWGTEGNTEGVSEAKKWTSEGAVH